jgi:hypothetical protein
VLLGRRVRLGVLTDAGSITSHLLAQLQAAMRCCSNATTTARCWRRRATAIAEGAHRRRYGHLSNDTSAQILAACLHGGLRHVVAPLSRENNRPELASPRLRSVRRARTCARRAHGVRLDRIVRSKRAPKKKPPEGGFFVNRIGPITCGEAAVRAAEAATRQQAARSSARQRGRDAAAGRGRRREQWFLLSCCKQRERRQKPGMPTEATFSYLSSIKRSNNYR